METTYDSYCKLKATAQSHVHPFIHLQESTTPLEEGYVSPPFTQFYFLVLIFQSPFVDVSLYCLHHFLQYIIGSWNIVVRTY
jgi:hypothetical protein